MASLRIFPLLFFVFLFLVSAPGGTAFAAGTSGARAPYGDNPAAGAYVQADGARIYYESYGEGKPVFLFHGGGAFGSPEGLAPLIDALRKERRVIVVSTRGHGRSEAGSTPIRFERKAEDMLTVMRCVTDAPAAVLGFSDGGYIAYMLANRHPEAVERIVTIGAGTVWPGFYPPTTLSEADVNAMDSGYMAALRRIMPQPERLRELLNDTLKSWHTMDFGKELLGAIRCPALLIAGDEDGDAPLLTMVEAHQFLPGSRLFIVPKASHAAFHDNLPLVLGAVTDFLNKDLNALAPSRKLPINTVPPFGPRR